jgi:hypothetical protein
MIRRQPSSTRIGALSALKGVKARTRKRRDEHLKPLTLAVMCVGKAFCCLNPSAEDVNYLLSDALKQHLLPQTPNKLITKS